MTTTPTTTAGLRALTIEQRHTAARLERLWASTRRPAFARLGRAERKRVREHILALERVDAVLLERLDAARRTRST